MASRALFHLFSRRNEATLLRRLPPPPLVSFHRLRADYQFPLPAARCMCSAHTGSRMTLANLPRPTCSLDDCRSGSTATAIAAAATTTTSANATTTTSTFDEGNARCVHLAGGQLAGEACKRIFHRLSGTHTHTHTSTR